MSVLPVDLVQRLRHEYFADGCFTHADLRIEQRDGEVRIAGTVLDRPAAEFLIGALRQHAPPSTGGMR